MRKSLKAALLSGLILPGLGHLTLNRRRRGWMLIAAVVIALAVVVRVSIERAQTVADRIYSGEIPLETAAITEAVARAGSAAEGLAVNIAVVVLVACWLYGIIDSWRLGKARDEQQG